MYVLAHACPTVQTSKFQRPTLGNWCTDECLWHFSLEYDPFQVQSAYAHLARFPVLHSLLYTGPLNSSHGCGPQAVLSLHCSLILVHVHALLQFDQCLRPMTLLVNPRQLTSSRLHSRHNPEKCLESPMEWSAWLPEFVHILPTHHSEKSKPHGQRFASQLEAYGCDGTLHSLRVCCKVREQAHCCQWGWLHCCSYGCHVRNRLHTCQLIIEQCELVDMVRLASMLRCTWLILCKATYELKTWSWYIPKAELCYVKDHKDLRHGRSVSMCKVKCGHTDSNAVWKESIMH